MASERGGVRQVFSITLIISRGGFKEEAASNSLPECGPLVEEVISPHEQRLKPQFAPVDLTGWQLPLYLGSSSTNPVHPPTHTSFYHSKLWTS
ncbi:hypothetical protein CRENBAI_023412 [Crenichthys baileyi]|uniref:Uncharacterized protein n=1 Tax=Crenichthys baileyi TaxID=28760 RepID=A0AAV9RAP4_9TELE